ncbi:hypothetical protein U9M48_030343 [Paspalum notatum var. saurae]|uniref:Peptidase A1 domain-containing protein n=1 Tax=Paspalum notatum var. saurae TaxID=547442 RepID=A0AAQ3X3N3_PASNO
MIVLAASMPVIVVVGAAAPSGYISVPLIQRTASATLAFSTSVYLMEFRLDGSLVSGIMDTGSDLTWTNNSQLVDSATSTPCHTTTTTKGKGRRSNCDLVVDSDVSSSSSSCAKEDTNKEFYWCGGDCIYNISYADDSVARGVMARGTLILGEGENTPLSISMGSAVNLGCKPSAPIGDKRCGSYSAGGIVGLGRGKISLVQQLRLLGFSYLLADEKDKSSNIVFYLPPERLPTALGQAGCWESTPLVDIQAAGEHFPRYYYVHLTGISMGGQDLGIPKTAFSMDKSNGLIGMIIDSGSTYTKLPKEVLDKVRDAVVQQMNMDPKPDPANKGMSCYTYKSTQLPNSMPNMELHFAPVDGKAGEAKMILPVANYMAVDYEHEELCLAMKEAHHTGVLRDTFILGNFQQKNIEMFFNISDSDGNKVNKLSFKSSKCSGDMHAAV